VTERGAPDETDLIRRCADGDESAWSRFVDTQGPRIAGMARRMLHGRTGQAADADVDEIVSEVFLALLRRDRTLLRRYDPRWRLATWLGVLTRTAVTRLLRRRRRPPSEAVERAARDDEPARRDTRRAILEALDGLGARERLLLRLRHLEGLDYAAIAEALGIEPSSVGPLLSRARARLRDTAPDLEALLEDS